MKVAARCWIVLLLAGSLGFAQKVDTEFDESADFSIYKTFAWRQGRINSRLPALDNTLVEKKIRSLIEAQLTAKGLREVELNDNPNLVATYILGAANRREVDTVPAGWRGLGRRRVVYRVTQGALTIDLRDRSRRELVWRSICTDTASDPGKFEKRLDSDVKKAFEKFPPKKK